MTRFNCIVVAGERVHVFLDLCDAQHFLNGRLAALYLVPAVGSQRAHALFGGALGDGRGGRAVQDQRPDGLVDDEQFVNALAAR